MNSEQDTSFEERDGAETPEGNNSAEEAIDRLGSDEKLHEKTLRKLLDRLEYSERKMSQFYDRWTYREKQVQAYVNLPDYEKLMKQMNERGEAPQAVTLTIPYTYATIATIVTYLIHTFTGRKPMFQVGANNALAASNAKHMETLLQYNADVTFMIKVLRQFFNDAEIYSFGAMKCLWTERYIKKTMKSTTATGEVIKTRKPTKTFEGNEVVNIDPFMFFPDPRVPISEVSMKGEYVFWREFESKLILKKDEQQGILKHVDKAGSMPADSLGASMSARSIRSGGDPHPGTQNDSGQLGLQFVQVDQGTVLLIPSQWGLGDSDEPEKWIFTILNKKQIVQAEPLDYDHDLHPIVTVEPHTIGYGFGQIATSDFLSPIQDAASWFLNSHIWNVRATQNNMFVVNPAMVEMKDFASPRPGKLIRLKKSALGQDVRSVISQLPVSDVTQNNIRDLSSLMKLGDQLSSVTDNLRGVQDSGSRKTATEVRTSGEAAASRLAAQGRLYSAQAISPLGMMMSLNYQQRLTMEFGLQILGTDEPVMIGTDQIDGNFFFPIHDGSLPLDKVAMLDIWKEILMGLMQDQVLRSQYDVGKVFEWVAELGGAQNIASFRIQVAPQGVDPMAAVQAGNAMPMPPLGGM